MTAGGRDGSVRVWKIVEESQLVFNGPATSVDCVKVGGDLCQESGLFRLEFLDYRGCLF